MDRIGKMLSDITTKAAGESSPPSKALTGL
jgi:hypothetical protein